MAEEVRIFVEDTGNNALESVYIGLHDSASKALLQTATTNATGIATFSAVDETSNSGVYEIRVVPNFPGVVTSGKVQNITVAASPPLNDFDIEITPAGLPIATNTSLCRCSGYFVNSFGSVLPGVAIEFHEAKVPQLELLTSGSYTSKAISPITQVVSTNSDGYVSVDLYRDAFYDVIIDGWGNDSRLILAPDASAANIADVLFPYVGSAEWYDSSVKIVPTTAPTLSLTHPATKILDYLVILRSGIEAEGTEIVITSSDEAVATVSQDGTNKKVTIVTVAAGTVTLKLTRATGSDSHAGIMVFPVSSVIGELVTTVA